MFQFWTEWKRKDSKTENEGDVAIVRTCSITSDTSSSASNWSIDWNDPKRTLSFKEDYVSFPSLEPIDATSSTN
ncbi:hypothetical protein K501DRAFT_196857 [Backusella circina FSU 941]|nr:hypothetical protein K501DRAFT_196857 [Backusella circina FSU 941]